MSAKVISSKQSEVQRIMDTLARAIAQHRLKPGQRLVEAQIVETLKANRNHVQTALQRLALQRFISIEPNRGAVVARPTAQEAREVFAARRVIERGIVEAITPQILKKHRKRLADHMAAERAAVESYDRRAIVHLLSEFHRILSDICGNSVLKEIFSNLMVRSSLIVALYQRNDVPSCASDEHRQVLDALANGDKEAAITMMMEHLDELEAQLVLDDVADNEINLSEALEGL